jgi:hypothetical protein
MKDDATVAEKREQAASGNGALPDASAWFGGYNQAMESWAQASASLMKGAAGLSQEIMTFSQSRFQAGIEAWQTALACRTPADLFENQRELAERGAARYVDDTQKFLSRAFALINEATAPLRREKAAKQ